MRLLVLGGTEFVGRAFVEQALAEDWSVTMLNRGSHEVPAGVTALRGDRSRPDGLLALDGGTEAGDEWDVVVDTWSWEPKAVRDVASVLADRAGSYLYVSSRSVYQYPAAAGATEDAPVVDGSPDDDYATAKAGGELAVLASFGDRAILARAGLILGPYENIGRLPWWLNRIAAGGDVLAPGPPDASIQYIDARDLAAWGLSAAVRGLHGAYNVVSPPGHATMGSLLESAVDAVASGTPGSEARLCWSDPDKILAAGVAPWTGLPIWLPAGEDYDFMHGGNVQKAVAAGLVCRPVEQTVSDTWAWLQSIGGVAPHRPDRPPVGLDPAVEAQLLAG
ncbi:NAD-dependent epimerase/dehydratase family protein [Glaciibacter superstes]|uniref:NAD-dependent epimerase/dehydratase family protein n=1 Tax=Glaciibacter superstes TaxID=501023 RepID=UPI0004182CBC|nr:NAD-dependent epimerase/dehydratase family protein [Glaciibacter superstes]